MYNIAVIILVSDLDKTSELQHENHSSLRWFAGTSKIKKAASDQRSGEDYYIHCIPEICFYIT